MEEELEILRACESYMQTNNIQALLKDVIAQLCLRQPRNPVTFLRQYFQKLERVSFLLLFVTICLCYWLIDGSEKYVDSNKIKVINHKWLLSENQYLFLVLFVLGRFS